MKYFDKMKAKYLHFLFLIFTGFTLKAQQSPLMPNYLLANQLSLIIKKIGLPVDSAGIILIATGQFTKAQESNTEAFYTSQSYDAIINFQKDNAGLITVIICQLPVNMINTAKKAILLMGMIASGTQAPPGYTAYATPKYAAFLNPEEKKGYLSLVLVQGGK